MIGGPSPSASAPRGEAVSDVVDAQVVQSGLCADALPGPVDVGHVLALLARQGREHVHRRGRQVDPARSRLPVEDAEPGPVQIDMLPPQGHDPGLAPAGQPAYSWIRHTC